MIDYKIVLDTTTTVIANISIFTYYLLLNILSNVIFASWCFAFPREFSLS